MKPRDRLRRSLVAGILIAAVGLLINYSLSTLSGVLGLPLYLDNLGTALAAMLGGPLPAIIAAFFNNALGSFGDPDMLYYGVVGTIFALMVSGFFRRGAFKSVRKAIIAIISASVVCCVLSTVLTWFLNYGSFGAELTTPLSMEFHEAGLPAFFALLLSDLIIELADKALMILLALLIYRLIPQSLRDKLHGLLLYASEGPRVRRSLLRKVGAVVLMAEITLGLIVGSISFFLYRDAAVRKFSAECVSVTECAALYIDPELVDDYIEQGRSYPGYEQAEQGLYGVRASFPHTEYLYCYRIDPDGCRVVFDLNTEELEASEVGELVEFDESFEPYLPTLFAGGEIDPIITDDTYGWLLTVYRPIRNAAGRCVCYVAADVDMSEILTDETNFVVRMICLFFGVSIVVIYAILELAKFGAIFPINAMAKAAEDFAYSEEGRSHSLDNLRSLDIRSGDEIGHLYEALKKMADDSADYITELREKSRQLSTMQAGIISDFAEMVEARDQCTGDHIKNTSHYVKKIAEELRREGKYADVLTDEYVEKLVRSAPLHDVGKIKISDLILNKPGKLTDDEFALMKTHTTEGKNILTKTSSMNNAGDYRREAVEMANYHHERWDGRGYPTGAAGEQIPLSARIMAVADVFDALVSQRSYKKAFSFEEATDIIREESGTHFDPTVTEAFLVIARAAYDEMMQTRPTDGETE